MMMGSISRGRSSYDYGNGAVGFFGGPSSSAAERLLYPAATGHQHQHQASASDHLADLDEEDVWSAVVVTNDNDDDHNNHHHHRSSGAALHMHHHRRSAAGSYAGGAGGLSLAFEEAAASSPPAGAGHSAPVSVPAEWPAATTGPDSEEPDARHHDDGGVSDELEWVPPHEYLRRRCGSRGASSVLEGAGRTLKGRDVTRVRDAVWSKTGFFG